MFLSGSHPLEKTCLPQFCVSQAQENGKTDQMQFYKDKKDSVLARNLFLNVIMRWESGWQNWADAVYF